MNKTIPDEKIIAALLHSRTLQEAATAAGLSVRALYDRMNAGEFQALYRAAKTDLIRAAVFDLNNQLQAAVKTTVEIMQDTETNPATRLQAAQTILNHAGRLAQRLQTEECAVIQQEDDNRYSLF